MHLTSALNCSEKNTQTLLSDSYHNLGVTQHSLGDFNAALDSLHHALDIRFKLFGVEHASTDDSYYNLGGTQHSLGDSHSALDSSLHALDFRLKLFGEKHTPDIEIKLGERNACSD